MLFLLKVDGKSMFPSLNHGDFILASRWHRSLKLNDVVVINHPNYKTIIKRINHINENGQLWLKGDNHYDSISSTKMGWVDKQWVEGKMIFSVRKNA